MAATTDFMVAIELGSTKITGVAGRKRTDGTLDILAYAAEEASACIRKGVIFNIDKTAIAVTSILNRLETALDASIAKVYVGIGGQSLHTVRNLASRHFDEDTRITSAIVGELIAADRATQMVGQEILEVIPQEYRVGTGLLADPVGVVSSAIEGRFLNIVAHTSVRQGIEACFAQTKTRIAGCLIAPIEMARMVLTDAELRSGCVLVDFGAETTTVQVYKDHLLRHLAVIPLGGASITKDICSLKIEEADAEQLKLRYASVFTPSLSDDSASNVDDGSLCAYGTEGATVSSRLLSEIAEARQEEIIANVWHQVCLSGYDDKLMGGIVVTGGASAICGLQEAVVANTRIEKFRYAPYINLPVESVSPEPLTKDGRTVTLLSLLAAARDNCCGMQEQQIGSLFDEEGEDAVAKAERERDEKAALIQQQKDEAARLARQKEEEEAARRALKAKEDADRRAAQRAAEEAEAAEIARKKAEEEQRRRRENSLFGLLQKKWEKFTKELMDDEEK